MVSLLVIVGDAEEKASVVWENRNDVTRRGRDFGGKHYSITEVAELGRRNSVVD